MGKVVSFSNQKGGVGKTTSCVNISAQIANKGKKVLMIDMDPQGNATSGVGVSKKGLKLSIFDVLLKEASAKDAVITTPYKNLDIIPANIALAGAEYNLYQVSGAENIMKEALAPLKEVYDYINAVRKITYDVNTVTNNSDITVYVQINGANVELVCSLDCLSTYYWADTQYFVYEKVVPFSEDLLMEYLYL